ncbi:hypothetical protein HPB52_008490 [Rhipicephalus sanguineus]|uniref:Fibroblast growth factor n=1 Tax=Rhipicephalus sanguineus TaxID=34632 RepID=A0A9D4PMI8_RHISA|nr:hypothetical protein HPB52_008490 [Rhipicephalus sanguineus]
MTADLLLFFGGAPTRDWAIFIVTVASERKASMALHTGHPVGLPTTHLRAMPFPRLTRLGGACPIIHISASHASFILRLVDKDVPSPRWRTRENASAFFGLVFESGRHTREDNDDVEVKDDGDVVVTPDGARQDEETLLRVLTRRRQLKPQRQFERSELFFGIWGVRVTRKPVLEMNAVAVKLYSIRGVVSKRYLCMNRKGQLSGQKRRSEKCIFQLTELPNSYTTFSSMRYSRGTRWRWYLSIGKNGHVKRGRRPRQKGTNFLPRSVKDFKP